MSSFSEYVENYDGFWDHYDKKVADQAEADRLKEEDTGPKVVITVPGYAVEPDVMPAKPRKLAERLEALGWCIGCVASETFEEGIVYGPKAAKAGEKTPDKTIQHWFVSGAWSDKRFSASWAGGSFEDAACFDLRGWHYFDKVGTFDEWLENGDAK